MANCPADDPNSAEIEALYPQDANPQVRLGTLSALCSYGQSPLVMQGALRQVLMQHFSDTQNILNSSLRKRLEREGVWSRDANATGIYIESLHKWNPELAEARPGLVLKEGDWRWKRLGIGDRSHMDYRTGRQYYTGLWVGSHTVFALATEGAEAQILGIEALKSLLWFKDEISRQLDLMSFAPVSIGEVSALKESTENYVVPITVGYAANESWWIQPEAPRLKEIVWRASEVLADY